MEAYEYDDHSENKPVVDEALKAKLSALDLLAETELWSAETLEFNRRKVQLKHHIAGLDRAEAMIPQGMRNQPSFDALRKRLFEKYG
jgi:hypothetical protein